VVRHTQRKAESKRPPALAGGEKLRAEGKSDQAIGKVKQVAKKSVVRVDQAIKRSARLKSSLMNIVDSLTKGKNMDTHLLILVVVLLLVFGGGGGYYWRRRGI
jgi:hypothetical protein